MYKNKIEKIFSKYINSTIDGNIPQYFIQMTETEGKLGINVNTHYSPVGIYGYPLDREIVESLANYNLPSFKDRQFISLGKLKESANILDINNISSQIHKFDFSKVEKSFIYNMQKLGKVNGNYDFINFQNFIAEEFDTDFSFALMRMGIDGIVDLGKGAIHPSEPIQICIFNPKCFEYKGQVKNNPSLYTDFKSELKENIKDIIYIVDKSIKENKFDDLNSSIRRMEKSQAYIYIIIALNNRNLSLNNIAAIMRSARVLFDINGAKYFQIEMSIKNKIKNIKIKNADSMPDDGLYFEDLLIWLFASYNKYITPEIIDWTYNVRNISSYLMQKFFKNLLIYNKDAIRNPEIIEYIFDKMNSSISSKDLRFFESIFYVIKTYKTVKHLTKFANIYFDRYYKFIISQIEEDPSILNNIRYEIMLLEKIEGISIPSELTDFLYNYKI